MPASAPRNAARALALLAAGLVLALAPAARADEALDIRLGRDVLPTFQRVRLHLDPDKRSYTGNVHVELKVANATDTVRFHAEGQKLTRVTLRQGTDSITVNRVTGDHGLQTLVATRKLAAGPATLDIEFTHLYGTRASALQGEPREPRLPVHAVRVGRRARGVPVLGRACFKFPYRLVLEVPAAQEALTNMPVEGTTAQEGWKTLTFKRTPPLPSYLLAIAVGPFEYTPVTGTKIPTRNRHLPGTEAARRHHRAEHPQAARRPRALVRDSVPVREAGFGRGARVRIRRHGEPGSSRSATKCCGWTGQRSTSQRRTNANVICHEMAQHVVRLPVTMRWWNDLWLNESFATGWRPRSPTSLPAYARLERPQRIQQVKEGDSQPSHARDPRQHHSSARASERGSRIFFFLLFFSTARATRCCP
jgi:alanyl aminopeptidase